MKKATKTSVASGSPTLFILAPPILGGVGTSAAVPKEYVSPADAGSWGNPRLPFFPHRPRTGASSHPDSQKFVHARSVRRSDQHMGS